MIFFRSKRRFAITVGLLGFLVAVEGLSAPKPAKRRSSPKPVTSSVLPPEGLPSCPSFVADNRSRRIESTTLVEASGLAVSQTNPGVVWAHNDSGSKPLLFAMTTKGADLGTYELTDATSVDWEDLAIGPGPDRTRAYLYVADTGANGNAREYVSIYRVEEPRVTVTQVPLRRELSGIARFDFVYPNGVSYDAEALMVDPLTENLYLVTKPRSGSPLLFRARAPLIQNRREVLEHVAVLTAIDGDFVLPPLVTAADISRDGRYVLVRTYFHAYLWPRKIGETIEDGLLRTPCDVPLTLERQGESIAFAADSNGYYTVSEGRHSTLHFFQRENALPQSSN